MTMTITERVVATARKKYGVTIYTHDQWNSQEQATYAARRRLRPVHVLKADTLVQHVTVTRPSGDFKADCRAVERIGMERFGSGVSYNFLVNMATGEVAVGQPLDAKGTHTVNDKGVAGYSYDQNHAARAIAVLGMEGTPLSAKAAKAIAGLSAAMMDEGALTTAYDYVPHSMFAFKDCPCDSTRDQMPAIRKEAARLFTTAGKPTPPKPTPPKPAKPTRVEVARDLLEDAQAAATKAGKPARATKIDAALDTLPKD